MRFQHLSDDQLGQAISKLPAAKITEVITSLNEEQVTDWREKTRIAAAALHQSEQLEALGLGLSAKQMLDLLTFFPNAVHKLAPILTGLPHKIFRKALMEGSEQELQSLRQNSMHQALQHQMIVYISELKYRFDLLNQSYEQLDFQVHMAKPDHITPEQLKKLWQNLCNLSECYQNIMHEMSLLLILVWNSDRIDLITALTDLKEGCHRISRYGVGFPETEIDPPSGLFELLNQNLFTVYGGENIPPDFEALPDEALAIDGLGKISAWYLRDYWELGLLPEVENPADLKKIKLCPDLIGIIQGNLSKKGLTTVKDLKQKWIYSIASLKSYLGSNS